MTTILTLMHMFLTDLSDLIRPHVAPIMVADAIFLAIVLIIAGREATRTYGAN